MIETRIGFGLICSASMLLQVILARIFAATLWYYFGTFALALSLLGLSVAGLVHYAFLGRRSPAERMSLLWKCALGFSVIAPFAVASNLEVDLSRLSPFSWSLGLFCQLSLSFAAFFLAGLCVAIVIDHFKAEIGKIYLVDLACSGLGAIAGLSLLGEFGAPGITFLASALGLMAAAAFAELSSPRVRRALAAITVLALGLFFLNDRLALLEMRDSGPGAIFRKWSPMGFVSVYGPYESESDRFLMVRTDGGQRAYLNEFDGDFERLNGRRERAPGPATNFVHRMRNQGRALVIGSAGGSEVLAALKYGQRSVTAVEINPVTAYLAREKYAGFTGSLFGDPRVSLIVRDGRSFVRRSGDHFDVIQLPRIDTQTGNASMFTETGLFTREAITDYVAHLLPGGMLSISRTCDLQDAPRLVNLIADHFERKGTPDFSKSLLVSSARAGRNQIVTLVLKNGLLDEKEIEAALRAAKEGDFEILYAPGIPEDGLARSPCSSLVRRLITSNQERDRVRDFATSRLDLDLSAPTDDRPFFYYSWRPEGLLKVLARGDYARNDLIRLYFYAGNLLLLALACGFVAIPAFFRKRSEKTRGRLRVILYFGLIGIAYFFTEVGLIQRLTVPLGNPSQAYILTLTALLLSSGLGAYLSDGWAPVRRFAQAGSLFPTVIALIAGSSLIVFGPLHRWLGLDTPWAAFFTAMVVVTPGFFMGMCFPLGIRIARRIDAELVPWAWAVNGVFSVLGTTLAMLISLNFGVKALLLAASGAYLLSFLVLFALAREFDP